MHYVIHSMATVHYINLFFSFMSAIFMAEQQFVKLLTFL